MSWTPNPEGINQIVNVLINTTNSDQNIQRQTYEALNTFKRNPEFNRYLVFILINLKNQPENLRICAGLILKNNLSEFMQKKKSPPAEELDFLKLEVVKGISDDHVKIKNTCGLIITTILGICHLHKWPGIIEFLTNCLDNSNLRIVHGAFLVLEKVCEDHCEALDLESTGRPVAFLLPKFLSFFNHKEAELRALAISCVIKFIHLYPNQMVLNKQHFIQGYFYLANDPDINIKQRAVGAFLLMAEFHMYDLKPYLPKVVELILTCMQQNESEELALEATEFWGILTEYPEVCDEVVKPLLQYIFPVLLDRMMYTSKDLIDLGADKEEDAHLPDKPQDIRPQFTTTANRGFQQKNDEDDDEYDYLSNWNIRKGSAEALDFIARTFKEATLPPLLPLFEQGFKSPDWLKRECSILGLGCIGSGCSREMRPFLPNLVQYLFHLLGDQKPLIRSITCWTLGRYSSWICVQPDKENYFHKLISELINRTRDQNKRVQKSATSAIAAVIESANHDILPYTEAILMCFNHAFNTFQRQNLVVLYDAISTLAEVLGSELNKENYTKWLLPPLMQKWESLADNDTDLFPVLECLSFVAIALGPSFPYAKPIYDRCIKLIESVLIGASLHLANPQQNELPNREFQICSLDLLSGLCEALKSNIEPLVSSSKLVHLLVEICKEPRPDVCQSCYALVGDLAKFAMPALSPAVKELIPLLLNGINYRFEESTNNAIWAIGEIMMKCPTELISSSAEKIFNHVKDIFDDGMAMETCAVVIGRLCLHVPALVAPHLKSLIKRMCLSLGNLPEDSEKEDAVKGLCNAIILNPSDIVMEFQVFCDLIVGFVSPKPQLNDLFRNILHAYKNQSLPGQWDLVMESFPNRIKKILKEKYGL